MVDDEQPITVAPLIGRRVSLRPLAPHDYEFVRDLELGTPEALIRFRHRARTPSPEEFASSLWAGVLVHFVIVENDSGQPCGTAVCYGADFRNGHAYIAAAIRRDLRGLGWPLEGTSLLVDYLFSEFRFRKLYGESLAPNAAQFGSSVGHTVEVEGCLRGHELVHGEFVDKYLVAVYPNTRRATGTPRARAQQFVADVFGHAGTISSRGTAGRGNCAEARGRG